MANFLSVFSEQKFGIIDGVISFSLTPKVFAQELDYVPMCISHLDIDLFTCNFNDWHRYQLVSSL